MATHSSTLAWRIPWTEEPGGLQSIVSQSRTRLKRHSSSGSSNVVYSTLRLQIKTSKGQRLTGESPEETSLQLSSPSGVVQTMVNLPSSDV